MPYDANIIYAVQKVQHITNPAKKDNYKFIYFFEITYTIPIILSVVLLLLTSLPNNHTYYVTFI